MSEKIVNGIVGSLGGLISIPFMKEIIVFVISMCPILELRGELIAASLFNVDPWVSYLTCMIGNIIPIPGTGARTGCLIASVLEMDKKKSFLAVAGVFIASIIMMLLSFRILSNII